MLLLGAMAFSSCDMDLKPVGVLDEETAIQSTQDMRKFRNTLYTNLRVVTAGSYVYLTDIQLDGFNGLITNGNNLSDFSFGQILPTNSSVTSYWGNNYVMISNCNALIDQADRVLASPNYSDNDKVMFARYKGEAQFTRAFGYFNLIEHFSKSYTQTDPNAAASGVPLVTKYDPTGDVSKYPGRATIAEVYNVIESDLKAAYDAILAYEESGVSDKYTTQYETDKTNYLTSYAVAAMQARVALVKGDYQTAWDKATSIISSNKYKLVLRSAFGKMWTNDTGSEIIFQPFMSDTERGASIGGVYQTDDQTDPMYIPNFGTLMMYDEGDIRFEKWFTEYPSFEVEGSTYKAYAFTKYPGNSALNPSKNEFVNMIKVFRTSEMYLIAAEAGAHLGGEKLTQGNKYLNDFCKKRYSGYTEKTYPTASQLISQVLLERKREFIGEGMLWSDLRRTHQGFQRESTFDIDEEYNKINNIMFKYGMNLKYDADDYRFVWPIPKDEIDANPQLKHQQNPGY